MRPVDASLRLGNAGLFVGVNEFEDESIQSLRFAVNDAVAQAHLFVLELQLIPAENATLLGPVFLFNNLHVAHHTKPALPWYKIPDYYAADRDEMIARR